MSIAIEVRGLKVFGRHGVLENERAEGQWFSVDVVVEPREPPRRDRIDDAIDYREIASCVREVVERERYQLLETLGGAIADRLLARFDAVRAWVRLAKPDVTVDAEGTPRVIVERSRPD